MVKQKPEEKARQHIDKLLEGAGWTIQDYPEDLIASFRNSYNPRIAVTVDMISTGTDIRPLECLLFMRDVKSRVLFEQMKGRGTRTISQTDFQAITKDAAAKTHFMIVDAVGVCENDKTDSRPLERKKGVSFDKLITSIAAGIRDEDNLTSLAGRLAKMEREIDEKDKLHIEKAAEGKSIKVLVNSLLDAVDPDKKFEKAREIFNTETPTDDQIKNAGKELVKSACVPFDSSKLRNLLCDIKKFIEENKDEITALQIIYSKPYSKRHLTYEEIREVADAIRKPPYQLTPEILWQAYEQLDKSKVTGAGAQKLLTNIVSLIRFASGKSDVLEPYPETVNQRFERWRTQQETAGVRFTQAQTEWLVMIKDHIATSLSIGNEVLAV